MDYLQYLDYSVHPFNHIDSFKPYYKWITFNTRKELRRNFYNCSFKPYYKWITFNTFACYLKVLDTIVLNLIINGLPSIHNYYASAKKNTVDSFKPYYKWITFNTN